MKLSGFPLTACLLACAHVAQGAAVVRESGREIPVAYNVDVVVVGGSTGAVAAAEAAAKAGASVFLATPRMYLGEDMAGTLRLWLNEGEEPASPLAKKIFSPQGGAFAVSPRKGLLPFTYTADKPSSAKHRDTRRPSLLADGAWGRPESQSVQYDEAVTLTVDLKKPQDVAEVAVIGYQRATLSPFNVGAVTVSISDDGTAWRKIGTIKNAELEAPLVDLSTKVGARTRYVRLLVEKGEKGERILLGEILVTKPTADKPEPEAAQHRPSVRPLHIKKTLDEMLLAAGVQYLFGCFATDVLRDATGAPCGIVMANRAGRQAVLAKTLIDATDRAWVARMAGARFRPYPKGLHAFERVVIGGEKRTGDGVACEQVAPGLTAVQRGRGSSYSEPHGIFHYTLRLPMNDGSYASWAAAEQLARDMTFSPGQQFSSDVLFELPPDPMHGQASGTGEWPGVEKLELASFRPADVKRLFVLGGCADIPRPWAAKLLRPLALMDAGARIGAAAAAEAKAAAASKGAHVAATHPAPATKADVMETLVGVRPVQALPTLPSKERGLPVLGRYDVVVIGGGTGGAPAGIGAARQGAKTLVVEILHGLGGVGTLGHISKYYWGNRVGFTKSVPGGGSWAVEDKAEWWRAQVREAGGDIWFASCGCGAYVEDGTVKGAIVATPEGRGVVLAKVVVDSTGAADIAAAAGSPTVYTDGSDVAVQGTGLPPRRLGASYTNTDYTLTDETDMVDVWHLFVHAKAKYGEAFDAGQLIDTRERRRILGDFIISPLDQINSRTLPDTIARSYSNFDSHGYTVHPYFALRFPTKKGFYCDMPYRAFLPKGLDGILVTGLGVSAHRDAVPVIRMQPDVQNHGYAIGVAAAMVAKAGCPTRKLDIKALQRHLVKVGNLSESVLTDKDSYPMPKEQLLAAVQAIPDGYKGAAVLLVQPKQALPLLRQAYGKATGDARLKYAHLLGMMGDATGLSDLVDKVEDTPALDQGWNYRGMGQFGASMSRLDSYIIALGRVGDRRATPAVVSKLRLLNADADFSHHRAIARALSKLRDPAAAPIIAEALKRPGMGGHAVPSVDAAVKVQKASPGGTNAVKPRREALRELFLAAALYQCGDQNGLGEQILKEYTRDLRGHFARFAHAVLQGGKE